MYTPSPKTPMGGKKDSIKIAKDSIAYCTSGLVDRNKGTVLSYLHKAIKGLNQLRMIEDSLSFTDYQEHLSVVFFILMLAIYQR